MWGKLLGLFGLSTIKFMFAPFAGPPAKLLFFETYFACLAGAILSSAIFYFMSEYFMDRAKDKKFEKIQKAIAAGKEVKHKKTFTLFNKAVVKIKLTMGVYGVCWFAPLFLSIPIGSIICAKFFGHRKATFPIICILLAASGLLTTGLAYFLASFT